MLPVYFWDPPRFRNRGEKFGSMTEEMLEAQKHQQITTWLELLTDIIYVVGVSACGDIWWLSFFGKRGWEDSDFPFNFSDSYGGKFLSLLFTAVLFKEWRMEV